MELTEERNTPMESELPPGGYRVVNAEQLPEYTQAGWRVTRVLQETRVEHTTDTGVNPAYDPDNSFNYGRGETITLDKSHTTSITLFLLRQDAGSVLEQANKRIQELTAELSAVATELAEAIGSRDSFQQTCGELEALACRRGDSLEAAMQAQETLRGRIATLERDISRIRIAIGEQQMNQILNPEE